MSMCSICAGTRKLLTDEPCGCKDGTAVGEAQFLRETCFALKSRVAELEAVLRDIAFREDWVEDTVSDWQFKARQTLSPKEPK